ncbi:Hypp4673 [Branchiostoma lanceolatum]|uniref:Hypp4673 protein n=1 Tax=Branchiostoma lanceolatum TaxID=7740 RepID=A0A8K0A9Z7_BRALA|nr:Hypp4673 [Branchiostoma lanceolatum]
MAALYALSVLGFLCVSGVVPVYGGQQSSQVGISALPTTQQSAPSQNGPPAQGKVAPTTGGGLPPGGNSQTVTTGQSTVVGTTGGQGSGTKQGSTVANGGSTQGASPSDRDAYPTSLPTAVIKTAAPAAPAAPAADGKATQNGQASDQQTGPQGNGGDGCRVDILLLLGTLSATVLKIRLA